MPGSTKILLVVETPEGVVKVVGTSAWLFDDDVVAGATVQVNGTVKGHAEYRETKQTTLIRTSGRVVEDGMRP